MINVVLLYYYTYINKYLPMIYNNVNTLLYAKLYSKKTLFYLFNNNLIQQTSHNIIIQESKILYFQK